MAIRGSPGAKPEVVAQQQGARPASAASLLLRLLDFGAARTPQEARKLIAELLAALRAAGFPVSPAGSAEGQLGAALKLFQESRGLPATGRLDEQSHDALVDAGHLPARATEQGGRPRELELRPRADVRLGVGELAMRAPSANQGRPEASQSSQGVELSQLLRVAARDKAPEVDLKSFLSALRVAGFAGSGPGATQLKDALKQLQRTEGLPQSGQLDAATAAALVRRGIIDERILPLAHAHELKDAAPSHVTPVATSEPHAGAAPMDRAAGDAGGSARTTQGAGDIDDPWHEGDMGNAPAGDEEVDDQRRGHANSDDGGAHAVGHWQVPALSEQIAVALAAIARDDDGSTAATYAWDVTLRRPGVYGAKQPAETLLHLMVAQASAFDVLWEQARQALNSKLALLEPEAALLTAEDIARSLRVARMKERVSVDDQRR